LDFTSAEAKPLDRATVTLTRAGGSAISSPSATVDFVTVADTRFSILGYLSGTGSAVQIRGAPSSLLVPRDYHRVSVSDNSSGLVFFTGAVRDTTVNLGPPLPKVTIDTTATSPTLQLRARFASQPEYPSLAFVDFQQIDSTANRSLSIAISAAYLGATPTTWELTAPDLSSAPGLSTTWLPQKGAYTFTRVNAWQARWSLVFGNAAPTVGETMRVGYRAY
jgi:hypothetical protein